MVRWGILGCGSIATHAVAPAIRWSRNGELAAVASRDARTAQEKAARVGAPRAHGSYDELLADAGVDAVYLALPNGLHETWALRVAEAGKHLLCEKSLALDAAGARRIAAAFRARGLRLVEGFMFRHHPQWTVVRELLAEGAVGEVRAVRAGLAGYLASDADHRWSPELGGGALFDVTCYAVNAARLAVGKEPLRVSGVARLHPGGADETTMAVLEFPGGVLASASGSLRAAPAQSVAIAGTRGTIALDAPFIPEWHPVRLRIVATDGAERVVDVQGANHFLHEVEHFASLVEGHTQDPAPAEDGVGNVAACAAIARSVREGRPVDLGAD